MTKHAKTKPLPVEGIAPAPAASPEDLGDPPVRTEAKAPDTTGSTAKAGAPKSRPRRSGKAKQKGVGGSPAAPPKPPAEAPAAIADPGSRERPAPKGKVGALLTLLSRPEGASVAEMMAVTGWQAHSVRGAMSGALKRGLGLKIVSEKSEAGRIYKVSPERAA